ncbi:hypothetical protein FM037_08705 [Shewanella psychropiezotolerans]|uniref:Orphan protein n=1 Tax=Shewanella psychropiezotolerans TaxID=2593655 RepID=A0ABX5WW12_9GAMM|nr:MULTISPECIES: hypothetical protein [Shewanella]MPY22378.1 hypothetical protein [Shewanella sp. YLB-07]QDO83295.1 hypothetical protein FM037_08705 [Shewanella psychropiezotolerans]
MKHCIILAALITSQTVCATELDFVYPSNGEDIDKSILVQCTVDESTLFSGEDLERAIRFNIPELLAGLGDGKHAISCDVTKQGRSEVYSIDFTAIKFKRGEFGSQAPIYYNSYGYGLDLNSRRSDCYLPSELIFDEECLAQYYGSGQYYLKGMSGPTDVQWHYHDYLTSVGIFIEANPKFNLNISSVK